MAIRILKIDEVAARIGKKRASASTDMSRNPDALPPHFKLPGSRQPLWLEATVDAWLIAQAKKSNALPPGGQK